MMRWRRPKPDVARRDQPSRTHRCSCPPSGQAGRGRGPPDQNPGFLCRTQQPGYNAHHKFRSPRSLASATFSLSSSSAISATPSTPTTGRRGRGTSILGWPCRSSVPSAAASTCGCGDGSRADEGSRLMLWYDAPRGRYTARPPSSSAAHVHGCSQRATSRAGPVLLGEPVAEKHHGGG